MKKPIAILLAVIMIVAMALPVHAVTPPLPVPDMPEVPDIGDDIVIDIPEGIFDDWFAENPVPPMMPIEPTEPHGDSRTEFNMDVPGIHDWVNWLREWLWRKP